MSHFSVCVVVPQNDVSGHIHVREFEDRLTQILSPYDEQTEEMEYREFEDRTEEAKAGYEADTMQMIQFPDGTLHTIYDRAFSDKFYLEDGVIYEYGPKMDRSSRIQSDASKALKYIRDFPVKQRFPDFGTYCDEYCGYVQNEEGRWGYTYNPNAKWDWWQIGGRFAGNFLVKDDLEDCIPTCLSEDERKAVPARYKYADAARKKDICWDLMKQLAVQHAEESYKRCVAAFESGDLKGFDFFAKITEEGIAGWGTMRYLKGETLDDYKARKGVSDADEFLINAFAFVDCNGDWVGSGDMGWFGISCNDKDERVWNRELQTLMNEVQDDDFIVVVDCHI